jgi:4-amino-4-deoxy-L-arabinose transferase-like glycosyltransferase
MEKPKDETASNDTAREVRQTGTGYSLDARPWVRRALVMALLLLGFGLRMINLTNPPLDRAERQLRGAIIARGMYYQMQPNADPARRQAAIAMWQSLEVFEPPIFERLMAVSYLAAGGEYLWLSRIYASLAWALGGLALYGLARRMTSTEGGLFALAFYMILPTAVPMSRTFQPDPLMVMGLILAAYAGYRWVEIPSWRWASLTGICAGLAVLLKGFAALPMGAMLFAVVWSGFGLRQAIANRQVWLAAVLSIAIPASYYLAQTGQGVSGYVGFWTGSLGRLLLTVRFYTGWISIIGSLMDLTAFFAALVGIMLLPRVGRALTLGLLAGYVVYGVLVPWQISTHDYYSLPLIPIVALGLAPFAAIASRKLWQLPKLWMGLGLALVIGSFGYTTLIARNLLAATPDYRSEPIAWRQMGEAIPTDGATIALTHEYGYRLMYYGWRQVSLWPTTQDQGLTAARGGNSDTDFDRFFGQETQGMHYFLVTLFGELDAQPKLKAMLYDHYPIPSQGDGYILFDLAKRQ